MQSKFCSKKIRHAILLGAVSYIAFSLEIPTPAAAQSSTLPSITVDQPKPSVRRVTRARRSTATTRAAPRRAAAAPRAVEPVRYLAPSTGVLGTTPAPYAGGQVATGGQLGLLGNRSVMDTPFNQTSYTSQLIQNQQARTIGDVLMNDPSVRVVTPPGNGVDGLYIRGFYYDSGDYALNGLYGIAPQYSSSANYVERVEVLKGPSALLNGMPPSGAVGGSVNIVTKRALDVDLTQLTATYASKSQFGTNVDISRRYGENKEWGVRFNGGYANGNTAFDHQKSEFGDAVIGLDFRNDRVRWSADIGYQTNDLKPPLRYINLSPALPGVPEAPKPGTNYEVPWAKWTPKDTFATTRAEVDLTDSTTVYGAFGYHHSTNDYIYPSPNVYNAAGNWSALAFKGRDVFDTATAETGVRTTFDTGPLNHMVTVNYSVVGQNYSSNGLAGTSGGALAPIMGNIYTGTNAPMPDFTYPVQALTNHTTLSSVGVADTISLWDKRVQVTVGARRQNTSTDILDAINPDNTGNVSKAVWSPAYAVVVKPIENVSLYANYIEGLEAARVVTDPFYSNLGSVIPPAQTKQVETGVKVDMGRLTATLSAFEIKRPNTIDVAAVGGGSPSLRLDGEQRNRGMEFYVFGEIAPTLRVLGGITLIDGVQTKTEDGLNDGKKAPGVATVNVNLGGEWDTPFVRGLTFSGRVIYTSAEYVNAPNTLLLPDWTRVDLGARYTFTSPWNGKPIIVRANVQNVFNKGYWTAYNNVTSLGAPRTYLVSTTFNF